jgi:hypothetical protein
MARGLWGLKELAVLGLTGVVFKRLPGIAVREVLPGDRGTDPRPQVGKVTDGVWDQSA